MTLRERLAFDEAQRSRNEEFSTKLTNLKADIDESLAEKQIVLDEHLAAQKARLDYQYDARKRLYDECEPLLFQLNEYSELASRRIRALARCVRQGRNRTELQINEYYLQSSVYYIFRPLVSYHLLRSRLSGVDLALDKHINVQFQLLKILYRSFTHGHSMAEMEPCTLYDINDRRAGTIAARKQDVSIGRLDVAVQAMVKPETSAGRTRDRSVTFGEFETALSDESSPMSAAFAEILQLFVDFHPDSHRVLWRILIAQSLIYEILLHQFRMRFGRNTTDKTESVGISLTANDVFEFRWFTPSGTTHRSWSDRLLEPFDVADRYLQSRFKMSRILDSVLSSETWDVINLPSSDEFATVNKTQLLQVHGGGMLTS